MASRPSSEALPAVIQLRPYQQRWIDDDARFKLGVKSARIGFSFATAIEAILDCLAKPNTSWTVLSASKAQSIEFVDVAGKIIQTMGAVAQEFHEPFSDELGATDILVQRIQFPNNSRLLALPANPRTARGYPGNAILDEFGHHEDSFAIFAAIARQVALGHKLRALSTPNGENGKFYDLAKDLGLTDGVAPAANPVRKGPWSGHWVDLHMAIAEGCPVSVEEMRELFKDDEMFSQEFLCVFLKATGAWLPIELIAMAEDDGASVEWPSGYVPAGPLYGGVDIARDRDQTVMWLDEYIGDVAWTRMVLSLHAMPFFGIDGRPGQAEILAPWIDMCTRVAMDATGMGVGLFDHFNALFRGKVMGINFAGTNDKGVKIKTDMAVRMKQRFEKRLDRIPRDPQVRQELMAIKREVSGSAVKFDAPRIEVDTAVAGGAKKKKYAHADRFWAKALASLAAAGVAPAVIAGSAEQMITRNHERRGALTDQVQQIIAREGGELAGATMAIRDRDRRLW